MELPDPVTVAPDLRSALARGGRSTQAPRGAPWPGRGADQRRCARSPPGRARSSRSPNGSLTCPPRWPRAGDRSAVPVGVDDPPAAGPDRRRPVRRSDRRVRAAAVRRDGPGRAAAGAGRRRQDPARLPHASHGRRATGTAPARGDRPAHPDGAGQVGVEGKTNEITLFTPLLDTLTPRPDRRGDHRRCHAHPTRTRDPRRPARRALGPDREGQPVRHEAPGRIPGAAGGTRREVPGSDGLPGSER